jgi:hypothetical protein
MNLPIKTLFKDLLMLTAVGCVIMISSLYSQPYAGVRMDRTNGHPPDTIVSDTSRHFYKEEMIDSLIQIGKTFLGLHYRYGGKTPAGFDCAGYVSYLFGKFGYKLPPSSTAMIHVGEEIPYKEARKGDLILFKGRSLKSSMAGHVALIIDAQPSGVTIMHSNHRGVTIDRYPEMTYYRSRFLSVRRIKL